MAAWARAYEATINPCSETSWEQLHFAECLLANLPTDAFDPASLLEMNSPVPKAVDPMDEVI